MFHARRLAAMIAAIGVVAGLLAVGSPPAPAQALNTTYYVDAVAGSDSAAGTSAATAWRTLAKVNATTFGPGDVIQFKRGQTWTGQLHPLGSGVAGNPITIGAYGTGTARPKIDGSTVAGGWATGAAVLLSNQQYWTISGLEVVNDSGVDNFGADGAEKIMRYGILVDNSSNGVLSGITITDNYVHDVNGCFLCQVMDAHGNGGILVIARDPATVSVHEVSNESYANVRIVGNTVEDVGRTGIGFFDLSYHSGDWTQVTIAPLSTGVVVQGNSVSRTDSDGIVVYGTEGAVLQHNVVRDAGMRTADSTMPASAGLWPTRAMNSLVQYNEVSGTRLHGTDGQGFDVDLASRGTVVQYNYSHDNEGGFLLMMGGSHSSDLIVRHNLSVNDAWGGTKGVFTFSTGVQENTQIYNNTVVIPAGSAAQPIYCDLCSATTPGAWSFKNNIVHNLGTGGYIYPNAAGAVFASNVFSGNHPASEPADATKITASPQFTSLPATAPSGLNSVTGYQIASTSPAKGSGVVIAGNGGIDYFDRAVSASATPSRGFHEAQSVAGARTYLDDASSWLGSSAHSVNGRIDGTSASYFSGDTGRYTRWDNNPGHVTWVFNGMTGFSATVYQFWANSSFVSFSSSTDGVTWTPVATTTSAATATAGGYSKVTITPNAALPTGTIWLKASFATSTGWAAQIGSITITK